MKDRLVGILVAVVSLFILSWLSVQYMSPDSYLDFFDSVEDKAGFRGYVWGTLLPIAVPLALRPFDWKIGNPIPFSDDITVGNPIGDNSFFFVIVGIWCLSAFLGGLSTGRGFGAGWRVSRDTSLIVALLFAILTSTVGDDILWVGVDWAVILVATFFLAYTVGGLLIIGLLAAVFGAFGGVVGKIGLESMGSKPATSTKSSTVEE